VRGGFISHAAAHFQSNSVVVAVTRVVRQAPSVYIRLCASNESGRVPEAGRHFVTLAPIHAPDKIRFSYGPTCPPARPIVLRAWISTALFTCNANKYF
ncbi:unnamed protein product, partial [Heterotrigona itama]